MKTSVILKTALFSLALLSFSPVNAQMIKQGNPRTTQPTNPNATFEDYKKECLTRVREDTVLKDFAEELCTCTMNEYRKKYSIQEFRALVRKSETDETARRTLEGVGEDCAAEIIFE